MNEPSAMNDPLFELVAKYLANLSYWGTKDEIYVRWHRESGMLSPAEFSYRLSDEFDQSILYLPLAFDYLQESPGTEIVSAAIAWFLNCWHRNLNDCGMQKPVANRFISMLEHWLGKFPAHEESKEFRSTDCMVDAFAPLIAINLLNELVEKKVPETGGSTKLLVDTLIHQVFAVENSESINANVLCFLLKVKTTTSDWKIYRHPAVLEAAFDVEGCKRHAQRANDLLKKKTTKDFQDSLRVHLLDAPASC